MMNNVQKTAEMVSCGIPYRTEGGGGWKWGWCGGNSGPLGTKLKYTDGVQNCTERCSGRGVLYNHRYSTDQRPAGNQLTLQTVQIGTKRRK